MENGKPIVKVLSLKTGRILGLFPDGYIKTQSILNRAWRTWSRFKESTRIQGVDAMKAKFLEVYQPPDYIVNGRLPSQRDLETWMMDSVCEATDGCRVEPDGICEHGKKSWLLALGLI